ncbi:hypothetical protein GF327_04995 [Candidatus Woesearchaeota archaeon]|nr:hypothetical protein [Candidatus Woesearchaeota archaeon]
MKNKTIVAMLALLSIGLVVAGSVSAYRFGMWQDPENREEIQEAIENNDFDSWREAMMNRINQENFDEIVQRHGMIRERRQEKQENREQNQEMTDEACELGGEEGYEMWLESLSERPGARRLQEVIQDAQDFDKLCELHELRNDPDSDPDKIRDLSEELSLPRGRGFGNCGFQGKNIGKN